MKSYCERRGLCQWLLQTVAKSTDIFPRYHPVMKLYMYSLSLWNKKVLQVEHNATSGALTPLMLKPFFSQRWGKFPWIVFSTTSNLPVNFVTFLECKVATLGTREQLSPFASEPCLFIVRLWFPSDWRQHCCSYRVSNNGIPWKKNYFPKVPQQ